MNRTHPQQVIPVLGLLGILLTFSNPFIASVKAGPPDNIKELKEKRLALLEKIHEATTRRYRTVPEEVPLDELHKTKVDVLAARLDLAETIETRIAVCEDALQYAGEWEDFVKQSGKGHPASPMDLLKAQAYLLDCRIALEQAKSQGKDKQPESNQQTSPGSRRQQLSPMNWRVISLRGVNAKEITKMLKILYHHRRGFKVVPLFEMKCIMIRADEKTLEECSRTISLLEPLE